jgi:phosphatidylglycerophosphate synthase
MSTATSTGSSEGSGTKTQCVSEDAPPIGIPCSSEGMNVHHSDVEESVLRPKLELQVFRGGKWISAPPSETLDSVSWNDVKWFYANQIDYARIILCLIAGVTIISEWHWTSAILIIGCTLLDWVDGPVARAYGQCSIMGSGWDWAADILCQILQVAWWTRYDMSMFPILFICLAIEVTNLTFDFATTATGKYPVIPYPNPMGFMKILDWTLQGKSSTTFYIVQWLAYPIYCVGRTLEHALQVEPGFNSVLSFVLLINYWIGCPLAISYIWYEAAYGWHIVRSWTEPSRTIKPDSIYDDTTYSSTTGESLGGFTVFKEVETPVQEMLQSMYNAMMLEQRETYETAMAKKDIFWFNLWQRTGGAPAMSLPNMPALEQWVRAAVKQYYGVGADGQSPVLDGFGFITNPVGSRNQPWHVDYTYDFSSLFVPMTPLYSENAVQYCVLPSETPSSALRACLKNLDKVDLNVLVDRGCGYSVRQSIARPFQVLRMNYATIHRGISNSSPIHRTMFYIAVKKSHELLPLEGLVAGIDKGWDEGQEAIHQCALPPDATQPGAVAPMSPVNQANSALLCVAKKSN